jgi:hypothetical protein
VESRKFSVEETKVRVQSYNLQKKVLARKERDLWGSIENPFYYLAKD